MDFNLTIPVNVISGEGCVLKNAEKFSGFGKKCIIVTGGKSAKLSGALDDVIKALESIKTEYIIYDKIGPNPLLSICHEGGCLAASFGADFVVGIGGGSPLDAAKAVAVYAANKNLSATDIYSVKDRNRALPLVLIGTTAGTGSEVGRVAVLTNGETGRKKSISPDDCYASLTFADSTYTCSMPYSVTVSTALDALCHALEGYFSVKCSDIPTMFAEKAVPMIWQGLKELERTKIVPEKQMREQLYYGSLYAGITLAYCATAFPHPLGYVLTENYGVPHGFACAAFLPEFMKRAAEFENAKLQRILEIMGESLESFCKTVECLTDVSNVAITKDELEIFCKRWENEIPNNFKFSPGGFTKAQAYETLKMFVKE